MAAVKRVQKLLRQAEKRATASVDHANARKRNQQRLALVVPRGGEEEQQKQKEEVFVKATGRAMEKALAVGRWFEEKGGEEYAVRVSTGSVLVVDDVEEDEGAKRRVVVEGERGREDGSAISASVDVSTTESTGQKGEEKKKKRKRTADAVAAAEDVELPETRTRWVNMVEVAVSLK